MDKGSNMNREAVVRDWIKEQKATVYIETSALKIQGIEELFQTVAEYAAHYQDELRDHSDVGLKHAAINANQLRLDKQKQKQDADLKEKQKQNCTC
mmetsp:Transcript_45528/g.33289  ORF Transcript_45528/g.33289 Transcript_45528/m.33289 type:complete len:96 (+) Transcript_45528:250-537(+)